MNHFLDVGANIGQTFDQFLAKTNEFDGWTVWCFDPSPRTMAGMMETYQRFKSRYHIRICPFGISGNRKFARLWEKDASVADSVCETFVRQNLESGTHVVVSCVSLTEFIEEMIPEEDQIVVKLDCEGSEYEILETLKNSPVLKRISRLLVEFHEMRDMDRESQIKRFKDEYAKLSKPIEDWPY